MRRLAFCAFGLLAACDAFGADSHAAAPAPSDGGTSPPGTEAGTSSGGPGPQDDAGAHVDATTPTTGKPPRIVQQKGLAAGANGSGGTLSVAFDSEAVANDLVIVSIVDFNGQSTPVVGVEDNNGRQLTPIKKAVNGLSPSAELWWIASPGGLTSVSVKVSVTGTPVAVWLLDAEGVSMPDDAQAVSASADGATASAPTASASTPSALVVSTIAHGGEVKGVIVGSEFTSLPIVTGGGTLSFGTAYRIVNQSGSYGSRWAVESNLDFNAVTVAFKP